MDQPRPQLEVRRPSLEAQSCVRSASLLKMSTCAVVNGFPAIDADENDDDMFVLISTISQHK